MRLHTSKTTLTGHNSGTVESHTHSNGVWYTTPSCPNSAMMQTNTMHKTEMAEHKEAATCSKQAQQQRDIDPTCPQIWESPRTTSLPLECSYLAYSLLLHVLSVLHCLFYGRHACTHTRDKFRMYCIHVQNRFTTHNFIKVHYVERFQTEV